MSWRKWTTTCLVAAVLGVLIGAVCTAVTGSFDAPASSSPSALPVPIESVAPQTPIGRFAPATPLRAANTNPHKASPPSRAKGQKESKAKPPKVKHKASGSDQNSSGKRAGQRQAQGQEGHP
jgi:hypothetical protein